MATALNSTLKILAFNVEVGDLVKPLWCDAIVGDQDGVVVVPAAAAEKVYEIAHGREVVEEIIKAELIANPGPPGKYRSTVKVAVLVRP